MYTKLNASDQLTNQLSSVHIDIDDRSIAFAESNVKRNHLDNVIKIIKNSSTDTFPAILFKDREQR